MRTIKFRAWDISRKCFAKQILTYKLDRNNNINLIVYLDKVTKSSIIYDSDKIMCNEFNLMQFTGLLDKNGNEVFENDIVKWGVNTKINKDEFQRFSPYDRYSIVEINPDIQFMQLFCINLTNNEKFISFEQVIKYGKYNFENAEFEVIGNIYENPELLEIKQ